MIAGEYEGAKKTKIVGIPILWEDADDALRCPSAATPLPISVTSLPLPSGAATEATLAKIPGLSIPIHDYISASYNDPTFTETYTFKTGGAGGTTVATVTVVYTDATKAKLSSVTKS